MSLPCVLVEAGGVRSLNSLQLPFAPFICARLLKHVYDRFVARVTELTKKLRQGPVLGKETVDCGAMVMPAQLDIVQVQQYMLYRMCLILRWLLLPVL